MPEVVHGAADVILVQYNAGTGALPSTGGISPLWVAAGLTMMAVMLYAGVKGGAYAVRRIRVRD